MKRLARMPNSASDMSPCLGWCRPRVERHTECPRMEMDGWPKGDGVRLDGILRGSGLHGEACCTGRIDSSGRRLTDMSHSHRIGKCHLPFD
jgi:hypothetical protein